jgi:hypothetical protein
MEGKSRRTLEGKEIPANALIRQEVEAFRATWREV